MFGFGVLLSHSFFAFHGSWNIADSEPKKIEKDFSKLYVLARNVYWNCFTFQFLFGLKFCQTKSEQLNSGGRF